MNNLFSGRLPKLFSFWNNYWFYPAPLFNLALCRVIFVGFQLWYLLAKGYGDTMLARADVPDSIYAPLPVVQLFNALFAWDSPPDFFLTSLFWLTISTGLLALIGLKTNLSLLIFAVGSLYIQSYLYSFGTFHHPEALMLLALLMLAISPAGRMLSFDAFNRKPSDTRPIDTSFVSTSVFARWPLLLIRWLLAITYLSAGLNKLLLDGPGLFTLDWMNGYTLQYYLLRDGLLWDSSLGIWLGHQHTLVTVFSGVAVLFEVTFVLTLFFPKLIWVYVPAGAMFHLGVYAAQRAPFFQYIALYAAFVPWSAVVKILLYRIKRLRTQTVRKS